MECNQSTAITNMIFQEHVKKNAINIDEVDSKGAIYVEVPNWAVLKPCMILSERAVLCILAS